jgi:hypothetical protein
MRTGHGLNANPAKQRKGPLRKIVGTIREGTGMFDPPYVELECGHRVCSNGQERARCSKCAKEAGND